MTKRTRKARAKSAARKSKGKVGGVREGSGPKPKLGEGNEREVIKTIRLSAAEHASQLEAVKRSGAKNWAEWARGLLNLQADQSARAAAVAMAGEMMPTGGTVYPTQDAARAAVESRAVDSAVYQDPPKRGAVVVSTDPCVCGHAPEQHGGDPAFPGSTACGADLGAGGCDCAAYEADHDALAEAAP